MGKRTDRDIAQVQTLAETEWHNLTTWGDDCGLIDSPLQFDDVNHRHYDSPHGGMYVDRVHVAIERIRASMEDIRHAQCSSNSSNPELTTTWAREEPWNGQQSSIEVER